MRSGFSCKPDCAPSAFSGFAGWYGYGFRLESALLQATGECLVCSGRPNGQNPSWAESGKGRFQTGSAVKAVIGFPDKPVRTVVYIKKYCITGRFSFSDGFRHIFFFHGYPGIIQRHSCKVPQVLPVPSYHSRDQLGYGGKGSNLLLALDY